MRWLVATLLGIALLVGGFVAAWISAAPPDGPLESPSSPPTANLATQPADPAGRFRTPADDPPAPRSTDTPAPRAPAAEPPPRRPAADVTPPPPSSRTNPTRSPTAPPASAAEETPLANTSEIRWASEIASVEHAALRELIERVQAAPDDVGAIRTALARAAELNEPQAELWFAERWAAAAPDNADARAAYANLLMQHGLWLSAERELEALVALAPENGPCWYNLAVARQTQGKLTAARRAWDRAVALLPDNPDAHAYRGELLIDLRAYADAAADFERAIELEPGAVDAHLNHALALRLQGSFVAARRVLEAARTRFPRHPLVHNRLAETLLLHAHTAAQPQREWLDAADAALAESAALDPDQPNLTELRAELDRLRATLAPSP